MYFHSITNHMQGDYEDGAELWSLYYDAEVYPSTRY